MPLYPMSDIQDRDTEDRNVAFLRRYCLEI